MIRSQKKAAQAPQSFMEELKAEHSNDIRHELAEASFTEDVLPINVHKLTPFFQRATRKTLSCKMA
jgi:hypothetical protein